MIKELKQELHFNEWQSIISDGFTNESLNYYADKLIKRGLNFQKGASNEEIKNFVNFIENEEIDDPYKGKTNLKSLRLIEYVELETRIKNSSSIRYIVKEDFLFDNGEIYVNKKGNPLGLPLFATDNEDEAKIQLENFEGRYFIKEILHHNARTNIQESKYWQDVMYLEDDMLDKIEMKLKLKGIPFKNNIDISQVSEFKQTLKEVVGMGMTNFCSIVELNLNENINGNAK